jgi:hypothetical protein
MRGILNAFMEEGYSPATRLNTSFTRRDGLPSAKRKSYWTKTVIVMLEAVDCGRERSFVEWRDQMVL